MAFAAHRQHTSLNVAESLCLEKNLFSLGNEWAICIHVCNFLLLSKCSLPTLNSKGQEGFRHNRSYFCEYYVLKKMKIHLIIIYKPHVNYIFEILCFEIYFSILIMVSQIDIDDLFRLIQKDAIVYLSFSKARNMQIINAPRKISYGFKIKSSLSN